MTQKPKPFPLSKVYSLLEPGPVVMLTTAQKGKRNVMTMSWHTMLDFEPPLVACVVSEGDMIVTAGQLKLHNGTNVMIDNSITPTADARPVPVDR